MSSWYFLSLSFFPPEAARSEKKEKTAAVKRTAVLERQLEKCKVRLTCSYVLDNFFCLFHAGS